MASAEALFESRPHQRTRHLVLRRSCPPSIHVVKLAQTSSQTRATRRAGSLYAPGYFLLHQQTHLHVKTAVLLQLHNGAGSHLPLRLNSNAAPVATRLVAPRNLKARHELARLAADSFCKCLIGLGPGCHAKQLWNGFLLRL